MQAALFIHSDKLRWILSGQDGRTPEIGQIDFPRQRLLSDCLHDAFAQLAEWRQPFSDVHIVWRTPYSLLLPASLLSAEAARGAARRLLPVFSNLRMQEDLLNELDIRNIYQADSSSLAELQKHFPQGRHSHFHSLLIRNYRRHATGSHAPLIYLHLEGRELQVVSFRENRLKLAASYRFEIGKDLLYYALLALKNLGSEQADTRVRLSGSIEAGSLFYNMLAQYFPLLEILKEPLPHFAQQVPLDSYLHYHFDLYAALCE